MGGSSYHRNLRCAHCDGIRSDQSALWCRGCVAKYGHSDHTHVNNCFNKSSKWQIDEDGCSVRWHGDIEMKVYSPGEPPVFIVPIPEKVLTEDELYRIWQMEKYSKVVYNGISKLERERFNDYDFEFRDMYEHAESMNFIIDHCSDKVKNRLREEYKFT